MPEIKDKALCPLCNQPMMIIKVIGYDIEFNYWACENADCKLDLDDCKPDKTWYSQYC